VSDTRVEIAAMEAIAGILDGLGSDASDRVLRWVNAAYGARMSDFAPRRGEQLDLAAVDGAPGIAAAGRSARKNVIRKKAGSKPGRGLKPKVVTALNFRPAGKESVADLVAALKPRSNQEMATVIAYYCIKNLGLASVNQDHIYSGFKFLNKRVPLDISSLFKDIQRHKAWIDASDQSQVVLTTNGENFVEHDLRNRK
jgi:hypothetical protein